MVTDTVREGKGASQGPPRHLQGLSEVLRRLQGFQGSQIQVGFVGSPASQSKIHKFREPRGLINFGGMRPCLPATMMQHATCVSRLSAYIVHSSILPTPPGKAEKLRLRQRAAARYACVRANTKIQFNRHRVSERAAPSRERPTPSWASRSLLVQDASSSGASKSIYLRKYRDE